MCVKRLWSSRQGSVIVLVAISLVVLIGIAALAIDLGQLYVARQRAQNVCDSAALTAVQELANVSHYGKPEAEVAAMQAAYECTLANNEEGGDAWKVFISPGGAEGVEILIPSQPTTVTDDAGRPINVQPYCAVTATGFVHVDYGFARIFGLQGKDIRASATAILDVARGLVSELLIPFAVSSAIVDSGISSGEFWQLTVEDWQDGFLGPGNWLTLRLDPSDQGTTDLIKRLAGLRPPTGVDIGDEVRTETGFTLEKTYEGLIGKINPAGKIVTKGRLLLETNPLYAPLEEYLTTGYNPTAWDSWQASYDPLNQTYDETKRIVIMPIIDEGYDISGMKPVVVMGFAGFFINRVFDGKTRDDNGIIRLKGDIEGFFLQGIVNRNGSISWVLPGTGYPVVGGEGMKPSLLFAPRLIS